MNSPVAGAPKQPADLLKSLADFTKEHRAGRWSGAFSSFLESARKASATRPVGSAVSYSRTSSTRPRRGDGRGLDVGRARKVLEYVRRVWRRPVRLVTVNERAEAVELAA